MGVGKRAFRNVLAGIGLAMPLLALAADPQIGSLIDSPDPVAATRLVTYTATVSNESVEVAANVVVTFALAGNATFFDVTPSPACAPSGGNVVCTLGAVGANGADVRVLNLRLRATAPGTATVTATLTADNDSNTANNTQSETTTITAGADVALAKTGTPDPVTAGGNVTYTLTASNLGPSATSGLQIVDTLPPGTSFVSATGSGWTCAAAGQVVTCNNPNTYAQAAAIPAVTLIARVTASGGNITNTATLSSAVPDGVPDNNTATVTTAVSPGADLSMTKAVAASPIADSDTATFTLRPRNAGPSVATGVTVTDPLPAGWTFVSAAGPNWTCAAAGTIVTCTRTTGNLPVGATDDITLVARPPAPQPPSGTTYTNTASITSAIGDPNTGNNSGSVNVRVVPDGADLRLTKSKSPNPAAQGQALTSTVVVTNGGPRRATGPLRVVELLPAGETYTGFSGSGWSCTQAGQTITCDHPNSAGLNVNASLPTLTINTTATASGLLTNTACTGQSVPTGSGGSPQPPVEGDPNPGNDCASASVSSTSIRADLAITKAATTPNSDLTLQDNEATLTYTVVVTNLNTGDPQGGPATGVRMVDTLPNFLVASPVATTVDTAVSAPPGVTFACARATRVITCNQTGGSLALGASVTFTITVTRPIQDGAWVNNATVSNTVEGDPDPSNNSAASPTVNVDPVADVQVTAKTVSPTSVAAGANATYVVSIRNNGPSAATGVTVSDAFSFVNGSDTGITVVSLTPSKGTCSTAPGTVISAAANSPIDCSIGTLASGEVQSITLVARTNFQTGNPTRTINNTATIASTTADSNSGNNSQSASLSVTASQLDLLVNKVDLVDPVGFLAGSTFADYRVRVTNSGPSFGTGVSMAETIQPPAGKRIRFVCDTSTFGGTTCNAPSLCSTTNVTSGAGSALAFTCDVPAGNATTGVAQGTLAAGQSKDIFLRYEILDAPAATGDLYVDTATVSSNEVDSQPINNTAVENTTVRQRIDLQLAKSVSLPTVSIWQPFSWTVTATNAGPADANAANVTDTLPAGFAVTGTITWTKTAPAGSGTCTLAGSTVTCAMGPLTNGGVATITLPGRFTGYPTGGTGTNTASIDTAAATTGAVDFNPANDTATASVNVVRSSLTGLVFRDRDGNGQPGGAGETAIGSVTVTLSGTDAYSNTVNRSVATNGSGVYLFNDLAPADSNGYTLTETQPAGYDNGPNPSGGADSLGGTRAASGQPGFGLVISAIPVGVNVAGTDYNYPELLRPTLGGFVYSDANNNGVKDGGEAGIAGATVRLLRASDSTLVATTTTNAAGAYTFASVPPDIYVIEELQPAGFLDGRIGIGTVNGVACVGCATSQVYDPANEPASISRITAIDVRNGDPAANMNFGELAPAALTGTVFVDTNNNGTLQAGEPGIPGVAVAVSGTDDRGNTVALNTTTNGSGVWTLGTLRPSGAGGYTVTETQPAGFANGLNPPGNVGGSLGGTRPTAGAGFGILITAIPVAAGNAGTAYNFAELGSSSISGLVWRDTNRDGTLQGSEAGRFAGVTIELRDPATNALIATATTDGSGNYAFNGVVPGPARLVVLTPPGFGSSTPATLNVTVPAAGLTGQNFGITAATLSGRVFLDGNNNGVFDVGDSGIGGQTIELLQGAVVVATTTTAADGTYAFGDLAAGTFTLRQPNQPAATLSGITSAGSAGGTATAPATVPSQVSAIALAVAADGIGYTFAEIAPAALAGEVFSDTNNNGVRDPGDAGIGGQTITLTGSDDLGPVSRSAVTAADGSWSFAGLRPGTYAVTQPAQPAGTLNGITTAGSAGGTATAVTVAPSAVSAIALGIGVNATGYRFAEVPPSSLAGSVYIDANNNGLRDPGETGIAGQTITLSGTNDLSQPVALTQTTDAAGNYSFAALRPGSYTLTQPAQPAATVNGITTAGSAGGTATPVSVTPSAIAAIPLPPATAASGYLFGEVLFGTITGSVFNDATNNGVRDPGDTGIGGQTITLTGTDDQGAAVSLTQTTDASGNYSFAGIRPGTYTLTQPAQPAGTLNGTTTAGSAGGSATPVTATPSRITAIVLVPGGSSTGNTFAELTPAALAGGVYNDANGNGARDPGEAGFASQTINLTGTNDLGQAVTLSAATDASGNFAFSGLRPGSYTLTQPSQPVGTANGITSAGSLGGTATPLAVTPSAISAITVVPGAGGTGYLFGELGVGSIDGAVYIDTNNNGVRDSGEPGIGGQTIALSGTNDLGQPVSASATTDGSGAFSFAGLRPGAYTLTQPAQPAGTLNGITRAGSGGGTATAVAVTPSAIAGIVLPIAGAVTGNLFGELQPAALAAAVFIDANGNGAFDPGEQGLAGQTIVLTGTNDLGQAVTLTLSTDASGTVQFTGLRPGIYTLTQPNQPAGTLNGRTTAGSAGGNATPVATVPSAISAIVLGSGTAATAYAFGEVAPASLSGSVYIDANGNGVRDPGETGIAGQTVQLTGIDDVGAPVAQTTTTDASGNYAFGTLRPGTYRLLQPSQPAGTFNGITAAGAAGGTPTAPNVVPSAVDGIALRSGVAGSGYTFGEVQPGALTGAVYLDANNNGVRDAGEPGFPGQAVALTGTDDLGVAVTSTVTTDATGAFAFNGLRPGSYRLTQPNQPTGSVNGITTAGSAGGTATSPQVTPSAIQSIALASGITSTGNLFGETAGGSLAGSVFVDANNNGVREPGEAGIAGQTVTLTGTNSLGQTVTLSVTTDASGNYSFGALLPGTYTITQPAQPAGTLNGTTRAGTSGGTPTTPQVTPSAIAGVVLGPLVNATGYTFGEVPAGSLAGAVFDDINNNGVRDAGESGFAANPIVLTGTDDLGAAVNVTVPTDANGLFTFANLRPGTYTLTQPTQPPGSVNGITTAGTAGGTATPVAVLPSAIAGIVLAPGANGTGNLFAEISNSSNVVASKRPVGTFATGNLGTYQVTAGNIGQRATSGTVTVQDRLPAGMTLAVTPTGTGWACVGEPGATSFSCTSNDVIAAASTNPNVITATVSVAANATGGANTALLDNAVLASGGGELPAYAPTPAELANFGGNVGALPVCAAPPSANACRTPTTVQQSARVGGTVWFDIGSIPGQLDGNDQRLAAWAVEVVDEESGTPGNRPVAGRTVTDAAGAWTVQNLIPGRAYTVRFRDPSSGLVWGRPLSGERGTPPVPCLSNNPGNAQTSSCSEVGDATVLRIVLVAGQNLTEQGLPVDPGGVVYDALTRQPIAGAVVTLAPAGTCAGFDPATQLANVGLGGYTIAGSAVSMTTGPLGAYQFWFAPAAPATCQFQLTVAPPASHLFPSSVIPPQAGALATPPAPGTLLVQPQAGAPAVGSATPYYLTLAAGSGRQAVLHNHIPLDPRAVTGLVISKVGSVSTVELGDSLQYTIRVRNTTAAPFASVFIEDRLPAGFRYLNGTAQLTQGSGARARIADPVGSPGPALVFELGPLGGNAEMTLTYRVRVGVGAQQGDGVNTAQGKPTPGTLCAASPSSCSNVAQFKVRVTGGVFTTDTCLAGKVFVDCNGNLAQDEGEPGIPGVRLWLQSGTSFVTDSEGKYSFCGLPPRLHVLKLDRTTLPPGAVLVESSNRNAMDPGSLFLDLKNGELHRGDFIEGSCAPPVIDAVRARRGEARGPVTDRVFVPAQGGAVAAPPAGGSGVR